MRITTRTTALGLSVFALVTDLVLASSTIRNPIRALSTVRNSTIHTANSRVTALSDFDLSFLFHDDVEVKLSLEPNHDIIPNSGAVVTYLDADGNIARSEQIDRLAHKVFKGTAWVRAIVAEQKGHAWEKAGWARITVRRDGLHPLYEGAFSLHHDNHHVQLAHNYQRTRHPRDPELEQREDEFMVVHRDSDIIRAQDINVGSHSELRRDTSEQHALSCNSDLLGFNNLEDHPVYAGMAKRSEAPWGSVALSSLFSKRQLDSSTGGNSAGVNLVSTIGQTAGCPTTRKVALVGVATDCTYTAEFNSTESVRQNIITQMNTASDIYERTFNISLGLQNLTVSDASCPGTPATATQWNQKCSDSVDIQQRLNLFSAWRGTLQDSNSHWTLLSTCNTGSAVGLAWLGQACVTGSLSTNNSTTGNGQSSSGSETVTGANVVIRTQGAEEWQIIAHETGHTFGAVHDCTTTTCQSSNTVSSSQCCPLNSNTCPAGERYIMNPSTSEGVTSFSPCSIGNICSALGRNSVRSTCLSDNKGVTTISGQQCGNGIVEDGEDCDCGGEESCGNNACCDAKTCKFTSGSVCDDSNEACCKSCQLASNGTECRASTGVCDPAETCSGVSALCPADVTTPDGSSCGSGLKCASGQCTSRDMQCKSIMGSYTQGNDTYACDNSGCVLSCASPEFGANVCYGLQQNFLDGTTCGGGGTCRNGQCKGSSVGGEVKSWIDRHRALVIGLASAIGGLLLLSILGCLIRCCKRRRKTPPKNVNPSPPPGGWSGWNGAPPPPQMYQQQPQYMSGGGDVPPPWQPPPQQEFYSGNGGYGRPPPPPPPTYAPRQDTVRYA